jgi:NAD(P)-dependent dehydrogenase (short-subunit alcohol dehydrogenase family)
MSSAIITGSSRGLGRAIALRFAADGYDIAVNYHENDKKAERVADAIRDRGRSAITVGADLSDPSSADRLVDSTVDAFGGVDHVVNTAGIDQHLHTAELAPEDFDRIMDVNVNSAFNVTKSALPYLHDSDDDPSITNMSSMLAHTGAAIECHYAASKGAVLSLTRSHAVDFAPDVRVNAVAPGHIETDMTADRTSAEKQQEIESIPLRQYGDPTDVADAVAYLRDASFVTGETLNVNGGETMR